MPIIADPIITTTEAKDFLNITATTYDTELALFVQAASQMIVNRIGVVSGSPAVSEWHDGGSDRIVLRNQGPIVSVTTVTETYGSITRTLTQVTLDSGSVGDSYSYTVDLDRGILVRRASGVAVDFPAGVRNIHVTYVAGYSTVPEDIKQAAKVLVKHLWETQRGAGRAQGSGPESVLATSYSFPRRVEEILAPYVVPGIA